MIKHKGNIEVLVKELQNNKNNAVSHIYGNPINGEGVLSDSTVILKDNYATIDAPTRASSKILEDFQPHYDATVVSKLKKAGAAIVGKVNLDELALGGTGTLSPYGFITNPIDNKRIVGGSSSGSAATFTNSASISIGSDTGDSVRLPASYVGVVGYKPSYGAISRYGLFAFASSLDTVGYFTHNVSDAITTSQVLFGQDKKDFSSRQVDLPKDQIEKPKSIVILDYVGTPDYVKKQIDDFEKELIEDGVEVKHRSLSINLQNLISITYAAISFAEVSSNDANLTGVTFGKRAKGDSWNEVMTNSRSEFLGKMVQRRFALGSFFLLTENQEEIFIQAQKIRAMINNEMTDIASEADIIINGANTIAPFIEAGKDDNPFVNNLTVSNFTGQPNIVIPFGKHNGMPFGLSIISALYKDKELLSHALYIEKKIGGNNE